MSEMQAPDLGPVTVTAILTSHNRRDLTLKCLGSYFSQETPNWQLNAILVDDGSSDGTAQEVRALFPDVEVVEGDGSLFWAAGMARAERIATLQEPTYILWLNDDVVLVPHAVESLVAASREQSGTELHIVSGAVASMVGGQVTYGGARRRDKHPMRFDLVVPNGSVRSVDTVHGNLLLVPKCTYVRLAGIDGGFAHAYADLDYGLRLRAIGGHCLLAPSVLGQCEANDMPTVASTDASLFSKWRQMNDRKRSPIRSQIRYLKRHGGAAWFVFLVTPYAKIALEHTKRSIRRRSRGDRA